MHKRDEWLNIARQLDWTFSYVKESEVFPELVSGVPWLHQKEWKDWEEPFRTTYREYVHTQHEKDAAVYAVRDAVGRAKDFQELSASWISGLKLHSATLPLAEFAAVIGNLRAVRFGRQSAWRCMANFGALDEIRHTQIPLLIMHELVKWDKQFDWTHRFYHSRNWVAIAARHLTDELLFGSDPIEFGVATNFVFETGFTNLQFVGLSSLAELVGDHMFEKMVSSIQTDEARHAQIGPPVLQKLVAHDKARAQYLLDKWFWRTWHLFAVVTGFCMDYFTPVEKRRASFKEFMQEWIIEQYLRTLKENGMEKPWYWDQFEQALDIYHHMVYASAYSYRATCWFDYVVPSPRERQWLRTKYPKSWDLIEPIWERVEERWQKSDPGTEWGVHSATPIGFCDLCQLVLSGGTPHNNSARVVTHGDQKYIFCSEPCAWIFSKEPERYAKHRDIVKRILGGDAPANMVELLRQYFELDAETWGKDLYEGRYDWITRAPRESTKKGTA